MKRSRKALSIAVASAMVMPGVATSYAAVVQADKIPTNASNTHEKIIGKDRYETGVLIAKKSGKTKNLILVNGKTEKMVDGLCASALVNKYDATILPINPDRLLDDARELINNAENVYIIGMYEAISKEFEESIPEKVNVKRIGGRNRFETSLKIARLLSPYKEAYLVNGYTGQPDAMSMSSVAAKYGNPILLVKGTSSNIKRDKNIDYTVIGGNMAVSDELQKKFEAERISGKDRYETNRNVLERYYPNSIKRYFTNGETLIDALSAASISMNDGITFVNDKKNLDLLENMDTVQIGGISRNGKPVDIGFDIGKEGDESKPVPTPNPGGGGIVTPPVEEKQKITSVTPKVTYLNGKNATGANDGTYQIKFDIKGNKLDKNTKYKCKYIKEGNEVIVDLDGENSIYLVPGTYDVQLRIDKGSGDNLEWKDSPKITINKTVEISKSDINKIRGNINNKNIEFVYADKLPTGATDAGISGLTDGIVVKKSGENIYISAEKNGENLRILAPEDCSQLFFSSYKESIKSIKFENFNTSNTTNMYSMFHGCSEFTDLDLSSFDTSKVTSMLGMFYSCSKLTDLDLSSFDTSKVTDISHMFDGCSELTNLDLSSFDTSKVTTMSYTFIDCSKLTNLDLSSFDTSKVEYMYKMFNGCESLKKPFNGDTFNTLKIHNPDVKVEYMFNNALTKDSIPNEDGTTSEVGFRIYVAGGADGEKGKEIKGTAGVNGDKLEILPLVTP